jgi:sensor histidine kinase YesM
MSPARTRKFLLSLLKDLLILVTLGNLLAMFIVSPVHWSFQIVLSNCLFSIGIGYPSMKVMMFTATWLERKFPWLEMPVKRLIYQVLTLTLVSAVIIFIGFTVWLRFIQDIALSEILPIILPSLKVVYVFLFLSLLAGNAVLFFTNWKKATLQQEELKRAHLLLQYQSLRDQIRPHFLFNCLSSLAALIETDTARASQFVHRLSDVYRYLLEVREAELVPVKNEVKFLRDYVFLEQIRHGERLRVKLEIASDPGRLVIPLSLQMLVENAIKHNEISEEYPLEIVLSSVGDSRLLVSNTLRRKNLAERTTGTGLDNLRKQIAFFSGDPLEIKEEEGKFQVLIPTFSSLRVP